MSLRTMKTISIQQPWAWLIVNGYKPIENRDWYTTHRGDTLIHAGKKHDAVGEAWVRRTFPEILLPRAEELPHGGVVGNATIADCVTRHDSPWFFGKFGFVMQDAAPLPFHAVRGQLGFFDVELPLVSRADP
jgi:hypothetical protein